MVLPNTLLNILEITLSKHAVGNHYKLIVTFCDPVFAQLRICPLEAPNSTCTASRMQTIDDILNGRLISTRRRCQQHTRMIRV